MIRSKNAQRAIRLTVEGLPLAAILYGAILPLQRIGQQLLVLALLVWLQLIFVFEIFVNGK